MKNQPYNGLKVRVQLVREGTAVQYHKQICCARDVVDFVGERLAGMDREYFLSILLNAKNTPVGVEEVSIGTQTSSLVHPRELFKSALLASAGSLILVHNHPSGNPKPSPEDHQITGRIKKAGEIMGVLLIDHIIIGDRSHYSFLEHAAL